MVRKFIAVLDYDESVAEKYCEVNGNGETAPGDFLEREFGWLEPSGISLDNWALTDEDVQWERYLKYLVEWAISHGDVGYEGTTPACYDEWKDCEDADT